MGIGESYRRTLSSAIRRARVIYPAALFVVIYCCTSVPAGAERRDESLFPQTTNHLLKPIRSLNIPALVEAGAKPGKQAKERLRHWFAFINAHRGESELKLIELVNQYFNKLGFIDDENLWHQSDYWATPYEVLSEGAGDCEDHAIAKYFTLRRLGIPEEKLKITYVRVKSKSFQANNHVYEHMVLLYLPGANEDAIVLDNLAKEIMHVSVNTQYELGYSFNTQGVWVWADNTHAVAYGGPDIIENWRNLRQRFAQQLALITASL